MADVRRTISSLLTSLFASGQPDGSIGSQDMRDLIKTFQTPNASVYVTTPAAVSVVTPLTYVKAAGTTQLAAAVNEFDMPANNRLRYTGLQPIYAFVMAGISMTSSVSNITCQLAIFKNDVLVDGSEIDRKIGTGSDVGALPLVCHVQMNPGDYIEVWLTTQSGTPDITLDRCNLVAWGAPA